MLLRSAFCALPRLSCSSAIVSCRSLSRLLAQPAPIFRAASTSKSNDPSWNSKQTELLKKKAAKAAALRQKKKRQLLKKERAQERARIKTEKAKQKEEEARLKREAKKFPPGKPRRPLTAFMRFLKSYRAAQTEVLPARALIKACAQIWHRMSDEEKAPHVNEAEAAAEEYKRQMQHYEATRIKKPVAPFLRWKFANQGEFEYITDLMDRARIMGARWRDLTDEEKAPHIESYRQELQQYKERQQRAQELLQETARWDPDELLRQKSASWDQATDDHGSDLGSDYELPSDFEDSDLDYRDYSSDSER